MIISGKQLFELCHTRNLCHPERSLLVHKMCKLFKLLLSLTLLSSALAFDPNYKARFEDDYANHNLPGTICLPFARGPARNVLYVRPDLTFYNATYRKSEHPVSVTDMAMPLPMFWPMLNATSAGKELLYNVIKQGHVVVNVASLNCLQACKGSVWVFITTKNGKEETTVMLEVSKKNPKSLKNTYRLKKNFFNSSTAFISTCYSKQAFMMLQDIDTEKNTDNFREIALNFKGENTTYKETYRHVINGKDGDDLLMIKSERRNDTNPQDIRYPLRLGLLVENGSFSFANDYNKRNVECPNFGWPEIILVLTMGCRIFSKENESFFEFPNSITLKPESSGLSSKYQGVIIVDQL